MLPIGPRIVCSMLMSYHTNMLLLLVFTCCGPAGLGVGPPTLEKITSDIPHLQSHINSNRDSHTPMRFGSQITRLLCTWHKSRRAIRINYNLLLNLSTVMTLPMSAPTDWPHENSCVLPCPLWVVYLLANQTPSENLSKLYRIDWSMYSGLLNCLITLNYVYFI
jgi:hypothetical protein